MTRDQFIAHVENTNEAFRRFLVALCCGDKDMADDIAQESLVKAYLASDDFRDPAKFTAWIFRIGYNTFINHRRSRRHTVPIEQAHHIASSSVDTPFRYEDLYKALDTLPDKERTAILLYYLQGYSAKEIAIIIDSTHGAVKQQLSRARQHLRNLLEHS